MLAKWTKMTQMNQKKKKNRYLEAKSVLLIGLKNGCKHLKQEACFLILLPLPTHKNISLAATQSYNNSIWSKVKED